MIGAYYIFLAIFVLPIVTFVIALLYESRKRKMPKSETATCKHEWTTIQIHNFSNEERGPAYLIVNKCEHCGKIDYKTCFN